MTSRDIREKYLKFFENKGHVRIAPAALVPENDSTTLFTSSGMQPLVPYLLGQIHPEGKKLVDSQPSFRAEDIEEVGDNRHTTFFEMLGNWSLGDYFKQEQLSWFWEFLIKEVGLDPNKLYVTVFSGDEKTAVSKDDQSIEIWKSLFKQAGIEAAEYIQLDTIENGAEKGMQGGKIFGYGVRKNWWSRSGTPEKMPVGEIGGPDSEVFYDFGTTHDGKFGKSCHPNCDCGRFMEIGNSVFIQYQKQEDGSLKELAQRNVDFGGGLERITSAVNESNDIFKADLHYSIIEKVCEQLGCQYGEDEKVTNSLRIIADHIKAATFLIKSGVMPSNKLQGYVLRRLLRRAAVKVYQIKADSIEILSKLVDPVLDIYAGTDYFQIGDWDQIRVVITDEIKRFQQTLNKGMKEIAKIGTIDGKIAFDLYQTFGFPYEVTEELFRQKGQEIDREQFRTEFEKHRDLSRSASAGMFKGGLADHSEVTVKYHTTTHLLHQALRDVLGSQVFQKGSNITSERLRFDFSFDRKVTSDELQEVERLINNIVTQNLKVDHMIVPIEKAKEMNAIGLFNEKYAKEVSIYGVGPEFKYDSNAKDKRERGGYYSLEFCGGPHVEQTGIIGKVKIIKEEAVSSGVRRIKAQLIK